MKLRSSLFLSVVAVSAAACAHSSPVVGTAALVGSTVCSASAPSVSLDGVDVAVVGLQVGTIAFESDDTSMLPFGGLEPGTTVALHVHSRDELVGIDASGEFRLVDDRGTRVDDSAPFPAPPPTVSDDRHDALVYARIGGVASVDAACLTLESMLVVRVAGESAEARGRFALREGEEFVIDAIPFAVVAAGPGDEEGFFEFELETNEAAERIRSLTFASGDAEVEAELIERSVFEYDSGVMKTNLRFEIATGPTALDVRASVFTEPRAVAVPLRLRVDVGVGVPH